MPKLYVVATPIGNLNDLTPRMREALERADLIAAEDTRVTMKLLNFLGLKKPMVSYYEHALQKGEGILRRIEAGESCALCSDAGMPCVSDPGCILVEAAAAAGYDVVAVCGACAAVSAASVSGFDLTSFAFYGFVPRENGEIRKLWGRILSDSVKTAVFYESPMLDCSYIHTVICLR